MIQLKQHTTVKAVVFDKDGTLIRIEDFWYGLIDHVLKVMNETYYLDLIHNKQLQNRLWEIAGFDQYHHIIPESIVVSGTNFDLAKAWREYLWDNNFKVPNDFVEHVVFLLSSSYQFGCVVQTCDLQKIFSWLKRHDILIFVATSDNYMQTKYCLEKLNVFQNVERLYAADSGLLPKPNPDILNEIQKQYHLKKEEIVMVGDSSNDILFAKNSGVISVYYQPQNTCATSLIPDCSIGDLSLLLDFIALQ